MLLRVTFHLSAGKFLSLREGKFPWKLFDCFQPHVKFCISVMFAMKNISPQYIYQPPVWRHRDFICDRSASRTVLKSASSVRSQPAQASPILAKLVLEPSGLSLSQCSAKGCTMCCGSERDKGYDKHLLSKADSELILLETSEGTWADRAKFIWVWVSLLKLFSRGIITHQTAWVNFSPLLPTFDSAPNQQPKSTQRPVSAREHKLCMNISIQVLCL